MSRLATPYVPRQPQDTVLFGLVQEHLEDFFRHARESYDGPLPKYVKEEFRKYLECGDFSRGFVHVQCPACREDKVVAFSCKLRGLCPSCAGRRMAGSAAHLVDCVLPAAPLRQYVLAFPYELSGLAATRPDVLRALSRIFWEALCRRYRRWAKRAGHATTRVETGAVTGVHRAGASLNVHVHLHVLCLDGVYVEAKDGTLRFEAAPAPSREELEETLKYLYARLVKWLARRGLLRETDASNDAPSYSVGEALTLAGMQRGTLETAKDTGELAHPELPHPPPRLMDAVVHERFNLHASVHLAAHDDLGRERLCRYLARPAFSLARFGVRRDGLVVYRVKNAGRGRVKQRVMTPVECLARLAAMVPPPRYPLLRLHGVLAPRHAWRALVVPRPPESYAGCMKSARKSDARAGDEPRPCGAAPPARVEPGAVPSFALEGLAIAPSAETVRTSTLVATGAASSVAPNILSIAHWERLLGGELYSPISRLDWATLLRRTFDIDVKHCCSCGARMTVRAVVTDAASIAKLLTALRRSRDPPVAA